MTRAILKSLFSPIQNVPTSTPARTQDRTTLPMAHRFAPKPRVSIKAANASLCMQAQMQQNGTDRILFGLARQ
jgi:hypothetical protein